MACQCKSEECYRGGKTQLMRTETNQFNVTQAVFGAMPTSETSPFLPCVVLHEGGEVRRRAASGPGCWTFTYSYTLVYVLPDCFYVDVDIVIYETDKYCNKLILVCMSAQSIKTWSQK